MNIARSLVGLRKCPIQNITSNIRILSLQPKLFEQQSFLHTSLTQRREEELTGAKVMIGNKNVAPANYFTKLEEKTRMDAEVDIDSLHKLETSLVDDEFQLYPDADTPDTLYNGIKFKDLPYICIVMKKNNTKLVSRHADQRLIWMNSPRTHGFDNAKKRTAVAGQVAGMNMGQKLRGVGIKFVRVRLNGFNQARESVLQGIVQTGVQIVCLEDHTTIKWHWGNRGKARPQK